jgi:hypothetical protein
MQIRKFRLQMTDKKDTRLLQEILSRKGAGFGTSVDWGGGNSLALSWS